MTSDNVAGKIKSVSVRNFVTYEECLFNPNEYLNVIIGPNGTGKSTLVAAIIIGFGGEPKLLSRSTSIQDYIKNGKNEASIAIKIYQTNVRSSVVLLERKFNSAGKSEFKVNGALMSKIKYLAAIANFKIQVGNLCQFLPQDRVHDFAKMNPQELFANTIKSVCDQDEIENFDDLKSLRSDQLSRKDTLVRDSQNLRVIAARLDELKVVIERYSERREYENKLKVCAAKQAWIEVEELSTKLKDQISDKAEAEKVVTKVDKDYNKIKRQQDAITQTKKDLRTDADRKRSMTSTLLEEANHVTKRIEELSSKIKSAKRSLELRKREYDQSQQEIRSECTLLEGMAQDLKDMSTRFGNIQDIKSQLQPLSERMLAFRSEITKRMGMCSNINNRLDEEYTSHIQMLKNRIERAHKVKDNKLEMLCSKFPNVFNAVQWLEQNRNRFRGNVYNPVLLELNVKTSSYAKYAENTIPLRDLLAITCEEKADMSLLVNELCVKQKLGINALYSPPANTCSFKSKIPIQNMSQYGFESYLIDAIEGPPSIMNYLCSNYNIHNIPIGGERVSQYTENIPKNIRIYYGGNHRYECSISKYSGEPSLMQSQIDAKNLLMSVDTHQIEAMKKDLTKLLYESDTLKNKCTKIQSEIKDIEVQCEEVRNEKRSVESKLSRIKEAIIKFEQQKKKIERLKSNLINIPEAEKNFLSEAATTVKNLLVLQKKRIITLTAYQDAVGIKKLADLKVTVYNQQSEDLETQLQDISERKRTATQTYENIVRALTISEKKLAEKTAKAKEATNNHSPKDRNFPYKTEFHKLPNTLTELRDHINEFKARLECMTDIDGNVIKENEEKTIEMERLKNSIYEIQSQENDLQTKIETIFNDWYTKISRIVDVLNQKFSQFMALMSYVGEISLIRQENYDFDSYGIQIMVQYRKEIPLQALGRSRQSGGERAVAIAVYSLSLQHITHVPFRCVDEINQGMDSKNERKIFEMLVQETTKDGCSQYFFVTPKLLPGLVHNPRMMVHIVFNGKFVKSGGYV